jgi:hypothetical protein
MIKPMMDDETMWDVIEAVFQAEGDWRENQPSPMFLLLKECGMLTQIPSGEWSLTDDGRTLRDMHFGPPAVLDLEDFEEYKEKAELADGAVERAEEAEKKLERASADCKRLFNLCVLLQAYGDDRLMSSLLYGSLKYHEAQITLKEYYEGMIALHREGEGDWW